MTQRPPSIPFPLVLCIAGWGFKPEALGALASFIPEGTEVRFTSSFDCLRAGDPVACLGQQIRSMPTPPLVIGWSMGGMLALASVAKGVPVTGLILFGATPRFCEDEDYLCGTPADILRAMKLGARRNADGLMDAFLQNCATHEKSIPSMKSMADPDGDLMERGLDYLLTTDLRETLGSIITPTLVVHGKADRIVPLNASHELHRRLVGSELIRLEGLGHDLPIAFAPYAAGLIRNFVQRRCTQTG